MKRKNMNPFVSPWMTIGISLVLLTIVVFQTVMNYNREKKHMGRLLQEKGAALIRSFEAGARTGMMGMMGKEVSIQTLLEETASQPDISYIFIVDEAGKILAHNNREMIGTQLIDSDLNKKITALDEPQWRIVTKNKDSSYFEVYKIFLSFLRNQKDPFNTGRMKSMGNPVRPMECSPGWMKGMPMNQIIDPAKHPVIFIGMDVGPFEAAIKEDIHNSVITILVVLFLGMAGIISLFWAKKYTRSRRLLQDTKALASEVINNLPMGIIVVNKNAGINYINDTACFLLGSRFPDEKEENAIDILPKEIWRLRKYLHTKNPIVEKEINLKTIEKKTVPVNVSVTEIIGGQGDFIGIVFVLKDLSQIKALERKIQRKEKLAALGTLASGIAHEVRNPLSSIKGYATFFASIFEKESENQKAATIMAQEVDRVDRVISELLEFARPAHLNLKETDMVQFIDHSLRIIKHEARAAGVKIIKDLKEPLPPVRIDPDRLIQVLLNLYINAMHAMENGGDLMVKAGTKKDSMVLEICDTGTGILPEVQANIFNPYFTTKKKGTGLGLAIAYKIIESHNGNIHIESLNGQGTKFIICLPINTHQRNLT